MRAFRNAFAVFGFVVLLIGCGVNQGYIGGQGPILNGPIAGGPSGGRHTILGYWTTPPTFQPRLLGGPVGSQFSILVQPNRMIVINKCEVSGRVIGEASVEVPVVIQGGYTGPGPGGGGVIEVLGPPRENFGPGRCRVSINAGIYEFVPDAPNGIILTHRVSGQVLQFFKAPISIQPLFEPFGS